MTAQTLLAQDDFSSLELQDAHCQSLDKHDFITVERAGSGHSLKAASQPTLEADEMIHPVNFIPDEVYDLIKNWELAHQKKQELNHAVDSMETESLTDFRRSESIFETLQYVSESAPPPKRFYRTFWRSVTRRILKLQV